MLVLLSVTPGLDARTWTDNKGRTIEADLIRVEDDTAIVNRSGREVRLPLGVLSGDDQDFARNWRENQETAPSGTHLNLNGKALEKGGKMNLIEIPYSGENAAFLAKDKSNKETTIKIAVAVPEKFDPSKPQKYFIVYTAVNNEAERVGGHIAKFGMYSKACMEEGWACFAVDSNLGVPGHSFTLMEAMTLMEKEWPGFRNSVFASGGFSGGAKGCWDVAANLVKNKYRVTGVFMGGCNEDRSESNRTTYSASASEFRKIRAYVSMGKLDQVATIEQSEGVMKSLKSNGIRDLRSGVHDGGHTFHKPHFNEALRWFSEDPEK